MREFAGEIGKLKAVHVFEHFGCLLPTFHFARGMVKISDKIALAEKDGRPWWSFEFFPAKTEEGWVNLFDRIERMSLLGPIFVDITFVVFPESLFARIEPLTVETAPRKSLHKKY